MNVSNRFKIGQSSDKSSAAGYYNWSIWIEEDEITLKDISRVTYMLHKTFANPVQVKKNRDDKFIFSTAGWGTFMINIRIEMQDGEHFYQQHYLILEDDYNSTIEEPAPDPEPEVKEEKKPKVFFTYSSMLKKYADELGKKLQDNGIEVIDVFNTPEGDSIEDFVQNSIDSSDSFISLESKYDSPWIQKEAEMAKEKDKSIFKIKLDELDLKNTLSKQKITITQNDTTNINQLDDLIDGIKKI